MADSDTAVDSPGLNMSAAPEMADTKEDGAAQATDTKEKEAAAGVTETKDDADGKSSQPQGTTDGGDKDEDAEEEDSSLVIDESAAPKAAPNEAAAGGPEQAEPPKESGGPTGAGEDSGEGEEEEKEFEPTIDMMINDFDDERTMEEEEALEADEDAEGAEAEAEALEQEADMPLEELLKMYGYGNGAPAGENNHEEEVGAKDQEGSKQEEGDKEVDHKTGERTSDEGKTMEAESPDAAVAPSSSSDRKRGSMSPPPPAAKKAKSELARFYEATVEGRSLRSSAGGPADDEEEEEDGGGNAGAGGQGADESSDVEGGGRDFSWKKTIMIGPSYQASVPATTEDNYGDTPPYENDDKLLWDPSKLSPQRVEEYLAKSQESLHPAGASGVGGLPAGAHTRDDEQVVHFRQTSPLENIWNPAFFHFSPFTCFTNATTITRRRCAGDE